MGQLRECLWVDTLKGRYINIRWHYTTFTLKGCLHWHRRTAALVYPDADSDTPAAGNVEFYIDEHGRIDRQRAIDRLFDITVCSMPNHRQLIITRHLCQSLINRFNSSNHQGRPSHGEDCSRNLHHSHSRGEYLVHDSSAQFLSSSGGSCSAWYTCKSEIITI